MNAEMACMQKKKIQFWKLCELTRIHTHKLYIHIDTHKIGNTSECRFVGKHFSIVDGKRNVDEWREWNEHGQETHGNCMYSSAQYNTQSTVQYTKNGTLLRKTHGIKNLIKNEMPTIVFVLLIRITYILSQRCFYCYYSLFMFTCMRN